MHESVPPPPDFAFLRPGAEPGTWETGVHERGRSQVGQIFDSEDVACRAFLALLTG